MISASIRSALLKRFPEKLVTELLECYSEQKRNLLLGNLRPNEVEGGRFAEAAFRMLEHAAFSTSTPLGTQLNTEEIIKRLANLPAVSVEESVRLHIPRTLRVIYDIRNKRDAAHLADGIDPNLQDSMFVSSAMDWILAEFVRISHGVSADEAFNLVKTITTRQIPAVEDFDGFLKTLRPSMGTGDRVLLLLYHAGDSGLGTAQIESYLKPSQRKNLPRALRQLEFDKDLIVRIANTYKLTRRGTRLIETKGLISIE